MFFLPYDPPSGEQSNYDRFARAWTFSTAPFTWKYRYDSDSTQAAAQARAVVFQTEGQPPVYTGPLTPIFPNAVTYTFTQTLPKGYYVMKPEPTVAATVLAKPFLVNVGGAIPGPATPWVAVNRFEIEHGFAATISPRQITVPTTKPFWAKRKARTITPFNTRLPNNQLWASRLLRYSRNSFDRQVEVDQFGNAVIPPRQRYTYHEAVANLLTNHIPGKDPPDYTSRDGPRNWGTLGYVSKLWHRNGLNHTLFGETSGRFGIITRREVVLPSTILPSPFIRNTEGSVSTLWGPHIPEDGRRVGSMTVEGGELNWHAPNGWLRAGDASRLPPGFTVQEMWDFLLLNLKADGSLDDRDGLDVLLFSPINHSIVHGEMGPAHSDVSSLTGRPTISRFLPPGEVASTARGPMIGRLWGGCVPGSKSTLFNEPWGGALIKQDRKVVWSNFGGDNLCWADLNGANPAVFLPGVQKTDQNLGIPQRLFPSLTPLTTLRAMIVDGPDSVATVFRPQNPITDNAGNIYVGSRITYTIHKRTRATGLWSTFFVMPPNILGVTGAGTIPSSSSSPQDMMISIDRDGTCGPAGDIFVAMWGSGNFYRVAADGTFLGNAFANHGSVPLRNGSWDRVDPPNYTMAPPDVHQGLMAAHGNDSGDQHIEITMKLATDPAAPNETAYNAGQATYNKYFGLTHGAFGYGELGHPNVELWGSWGDAVLTAYLTSWGVPAAEVANLITWTRWQCVDLDYSIPELPPDAPTASLSLISIN